MEDSMILNNSMGVCSILSGFGFIFGEDYSDYYSSVTGMEMSNTELMEAAGDVFDIKKALNVREGFNREYDKIPEVWLRPMNTPEGVIELKDYFDTKVINEEDINDNNLRKHLKEIIKDYGKDNVHIITPQHKYEVGTENVNKEMQNMISNTKTNKEIARYFDKIFVTLFLNV